MPFTPKEIKHLEDMGHAYCVHMSREQIRELHGEAMTQGAEWPLDAPQPSAPAHHIDLAVASDLGGRIRLVLTIDGKSDLFTMYPRVAASLIAELAKALAKSA